MSKDLFLGSQKSNKVRAFYSCFAPKLQQPSYCLEYVSAYSITISLKLALLPCIPG